MKKIILLGIIIFCFQEASLLLAQEESDSALIQEKTQDNKKEKGVMEKFLSPEAEASVIPQEKNFFEEGFNNCLDLCESVNNWKMEEFLKDKIALPEPVYFKTRRDIDISYGKDKALDFGRKDFAFGLSWYDSRNKLKDENGRKDFKFGIEVGVDRNETEFLAGVKKKF